MNRKYTTAQYADIVNGLRSVFDNVAITTDMMVGFPGETEEEFEESYHFAEKMGFSHIHVFQYSRRKQTKAYSMENQVEKSIKEQRSHKLLSLSQKSCQPFLKQQIGSTAKVLFEQKTDDGFWEGKTPNYLSVRVMSDTPLVGKIIPVTITHFKNETLYAAIKNE